MRLEQKVIVVTGSATGIGRAMARRFVREGARVLVHGLEEDLAAELVQELGSERASMHVEDLLVEGCVGRLVEAAVKAFGRLDGVVNNAAWVGTGNVHTTDAAGFHRMLAVNTVAPFLLIQAALPELARNRGAVLNIGSVNAHGGEENLMAYSVSKGALSTLTRNLGDTLMRKEGVRVNQINPGWVLTENESARKRSHGLSDDWMTRLPKMYAPAGRILYPEEIAAAAVYWMSDEAGPISGQVMDLEQYPAQGRNPPKDGEHLPNLAR
jgi:NAD(P)-dependent dehydrogenase (short-subunit alcohol dehydrogenase family)